MRPFAPTARMRMASSPLLGLDRTDRWAHKLALVVVYGVPNTAGVVREEGRGVPSAFPAGPWSGFGKCHIRPPNPTQPNPI